MYAHLWDRIMNILLYLPFHIAVYPSIFYLCVLFILKLPLCSSSHHTPGLFLVLFPAVTAPPIFLCQWSPDWWCLNYLLMYRKKMLELIFHNVLIGRKIKLLYYFMYRLLMAFLLILYVRLYVDYQSVLRQEWVWQSHFYQRHSKVLVYLCPIKCIYGLCYTISNPYKIEM